MSYRIGLLPGDGIGPEVLGAGVRVLDTIADLHGLELHYVKLMAGGAAIDAYGTPLRDEDLERCRETRALLLGAVGGPAWDDLPVQSRPERALLLLRSQLGLGINLRPVWWTPVTGIRSPLRTEVVEGADIAFVRELTGGIYFGRPSYRRETESGQEAVDTAHYSEEQILPVLKFAFDLARSRGRRVCSVDKANVMNTSRLWREVATEYGRCNPDVELEHCLVDSFAMRLIQSPGRFDVVVTENLFGDILTDLGGVIAGSLGVLPSASLRGDPLGTESRSPSPADGSPEGRFGLYEPVHGSAPGIAGLGIANPIGCILSVALMLEWSLNRADLAREIRSAVDVTMRAGYITADLAGGDRNGVSTEVFVDAVVAALEETGGARGRQSVRYHVA